MRSSVAAEKGGEGMALKILIRAEGMPDGKINVESQAHRKWKGAALIKQFALFLLGKPGDERACSFCIVFEIFIAGVFFFQHRNSRDSEKQEGDK